MKTYHVGVSGWAKVVVKANSETEAMDKVDALLDAGVETSDVEPRGADELYDWVVESAIEVADQDEVSV